MIGLLSKRFWLIYIEVKTGCNVLQMHWFVKKINEKSLPLIEKFYSKLKKGILNKGYRHAQRVSI